MLTSLDDKLWFPDPDKAPVRGARAGLVAFGGDLSVDRLLLAYGSGIFPWTENPITWWSPDPRGILCLDQVHVSRSLVRFLKKHPYQITVNRAFVEVMQGCTGPRKHETGTWITDGFLEAYCAMHRAGHAHSVECWHGEELVGGIYGVAVGGLFAGESMFHRADNASKARPLVADKRNVGKVQE